MRKPTLQVRGRAGMRLAEQKQQKHKEHETYETMTNQQNITPTFDVSI